MANPAKRKDIQRLAHELVDGVDQFRRELAVADARVQQQSAEIERLRADNAGLRFRLADLQRGIDHDPATCALLVCNRCDP